MVWAQPTIHKTQEDEDREVLSRYLNLRSKLNAVNALSATPGNEVDKESLARVLQTIQEVVKGLDKHFSDRFPPAHYNQIRYDDFTIADRVLNIPELLELVLEHVDLVDIVTMGRVSHGLRDTIEASPKLQIRLHLKAANTSELKGHGHETIPIKGFPGISVEHNAYPFSQMTVDLCLLLAGEAKHLPRIGKTWRRMLIRQPPTKNVEAFRLCASHGPIEEKAVILSSKTWLTVGDLYQEADKMLEDRVPPLCWFNSFRSPLVDRECKIAGVGFVYLDSTN